jgi:hypothetical protein
MLFASAANAGFWLVHYDLAPASNIVTVNPGGTFNDPVTGKVRMFYDAATIAAPLSNPRLMAGQLDNTLNQPAGILTVTGSIMNALTPGLAGTPGTFSGAALNLSVVANHTVSGFLHCYDVTGPGGVCSIFFSGVPSSNQIPQTGTGPFTMPQLNFTSGTAGVGDFTSTASVQMTPMMSVTTTTTYIGKEILRTFFVPEPSGVAMLVPGALMLMGLGAARRASKKP